MSHTIGELIIYTIYSLYEWSLCYNIRLPPKNLAISVFESKPYKAYTSLNYYKTTSGLLLNMTQFNPFLEFFTFGDLE